MVSSNKLWDLVSKIDYFHSSVKVKNTEYSRERSVRRLYQHIKSAFWGKLKTTFHDRYHCETEGEIGLISI